MFYKPYSSRLLYLLIILTCLCCYGATTSEISHEFFGRIDLERAELSSVKTAYLSGDHASALEGYKNIFIDRMAALDLGSADGFWSQGATSQSMAYSGTIQMDAMGTGYCTDNIGLPGNVEWFPLVDCYIDFGRDVSSMHWTGIILKGYFSGNDEYLVRFCDYWNDFGVNWMAQRPPNGSPYSDTLHWAWKSGLYLAWRIDNFMRFYSAACTYDAAAAKASISGEKLANILNQLATLEIPDLAGFRYPSTPNQQVLSIQALLKAAASMEDFKDAENWRSFALTKAQEYVTAGSYLADGSDQEQSFNYNAGLVGSAQQMIDLINQIMPGDEQAQNLVEQLTEVKLYRTRFLEMLKSPIGSTPATGTSSMSVPAAYTSNVYDNFTSVYYPYGGYTMLRSLWQNDALYAFFKSSRIGYGHYVEDGLHLTLCAYGKNLLIAGGPNSYSGEAIDSYYRSSFSRNTIAVDGFGQSSRQGNEMPAEGYPEPIDALWHSSPNFDLAEGSYPYGYGDKITDVTHKRQLLFARQLGLFVVVDRLLSSQVHDYTLTWGFDSVFDSSDVHYDSAAKKLYTDKTNSVNLAIHHFTSASLSPTMYYGDSANLKGWYTPVSGHDNNIAKVDAHLNWRGSGNQQVVSLLDPQSSQSIDIQTITPYDNGFDLAMENGASMSFRASGQSQTFDVMGVNVAAKMLAVQDTGGQTLNGMVLASGDSISIDGRSFTCRYQDYEFSFDGSSLSITEIKVPQTFRWEGEGSHIKPQYQPQAQQGSSEAIWWNMDGQQTAAFENSAGASYAAVLSGEPICQNDGGIRKGCFEFDGVDDRVSIDDAFMPAAGSQPRTVAVWIRTADGGDIVSWGQKSASALWSLRINDEGKVAIDVQGGELIGQTDLLDDKWHHIALVLPQANTGWLSDAVMYIDGKREQPALVIDYEVATLGSGVVIGSDVDGISYYKGSLDEVLIAGIELTDGQITQLYRGGCDSFAMPCGGLVFDSRKRLIADVNYDCRIDIHDLSLISESWLAIQTPFTADLNADDLIDMDDYSLLASNWQNILPLLWWPFDTFQNGIAEDIGVLDIDGIAAGSPALVSRAADMAVAFDGIDDRITVAYFDGVIGSSQRSVSMWIKVQDCGGLLSWGDAAGQVFTVAVQQQYGLPGTLALLAGTGYRIGRTDLRDGQWHHIAAVLPDDGSADVWESKLYVDGVEERYSSFRSCRVDTSPGMLVAGSNISGADYFTGAMDDIRIYDRSLSSEAIAKIMQE